MNQVPVLKSKKEFDDWIKISNLFAKSLISPKTALRQYNRLIPEKRRRIIQLFAQYDEIRKIKIPKGELDNNWAMSIMVDAHIIATEFDIDPLVVMMCVKSIGRPNEQIVYK